MATFKREGKNNSTTKTVSEVTTIVKSVAHTRRRVGSMAQTRRHPRKPQKALSTFLDNARIYARVLTYDVRRKVLANVVLDAPRSYKAYHSLQGKNNIEDGFAPKQELNPDLRHDLHIWRKSSCLQKMWQQGPMKNESNPIQREKGPAKHLSTFGRGKRV